MNWQQLNDGDPHIEFVSNKSTFQWNGPAQQLMGNPRAIELFYDAQAGRLGFRKAPWYAPLRVLTSDDLAYAVDVKTYLQKAGLSWPDSWEATPELITDPPQPGEFDARGIVWVEVP